MTWHTPSLSLLSSPSLTLIICQTHPYLLPAKTPRHQVHRCPTTGPDTKSSVSHDEDHHCRRVGDGAGGLAGAAQTRSAVQASSAVDAAGAATSQASSPATMADDAGTRGRSGGVPSAAAAVNVGVARRRGRAYRREA
jgi:hypothetical protein